MIREKNIAQSIKRRINVGSAELVRRYLQTKEFGQQKPSCSFIDIQVGQRPTTQHPAQDSAIYTYTAGAYSVEMNRSDSSAYVDMNITAERIYLLEIASSYTACLDDFFFQRKLGKSAHDKCVFSYP